LWVVVGGGGGGGGVSDTSVGAGCAHFYFSLGIS